MYARLAFVNLGKDSSLCVKILVNEKNVNQFYFLLLWKCVQPEDGYIAETCSSLSPIDKVVFKFDLPSFYSQARAIFSQPTQQLCIPAAVIETNRNTSFKRVKETFDCQTAG